MSLLSTLATQINSEFQAILPAINQVIEDMTKNYSDWQSKPVVKATEAAVVLVSPVAALDVQAAIGAASLVQALWEVYGAQKVAPAVPSLQTVGISTVLPTIAQNPAPASVPAAVSDVNPFSNGLTDQSHM